MLALSVVQGDLNGPARYLDWGPLQISVGNLIVVGAIVLMFVLAIALPFPKGRDRS